jgi:hypothetical protein
MAGEQSFRELQTSDCGSPSEAFRDIDTCGTRGAASSRDPNPSDAPAILGRLRVEEAAHHVT